MNLFPIDLIKETDVRNQNSSSIMTKGLLFLKNCNGKRNTIHIHDQSGTNTTKLLKYKQIKLFSYSLLHKRLINCL